jgi:hypothetical protein
VIVSDENIETSYKNDFETLKENTEITKDIEKFKPYFDKKADKNLTLEL